MSGEELKQYIKRSGLTMSDVAREMGTTPQNVQARLGRKNIKIDFIQKIKEIIDKCAPALPAEMESAVLIARTFPNPSVATLPCKRKTSCCVNKMSSCKSKSRT